MFQKANAKVAKYTFPVIVSRQKVSGDCSSSIAAFMVLNDEGWIITAYHVLAAFQKLRDEVAAHREAEAKVAAINADQTLSNKQRKQQLGAVQPKATATKRCSAWFGARPCRLAEWGGIEVADVAIGRLQPWDAKWVSEFPVFKDPTADDFEPGTSLCKHGYPFHLFRPTWNDATNQFVLPPEALPVPRFPMEGIFTRHLDVADKNGKRLQGPYPIQFLETSSPGLKGQSGGPIFDQHGNVWAIQSHVHSYSLGWEGEVPKTKQKVPQFLNVGRGVHASTILGLLRERKIKFEPPQR